MTTTMFTERTAIRERIQEIKQEKAELRNRYYEEKSTLETEYSMLLERLREMDESNSMQVDMESLVGSLIDSVNILSQIAPKPNVHQIVNAIKSPEMEEMVHNIVEEIHEEVKEKHTIKTADIEESKERESKKTVTKRRSYNDLASKAPQIVSIMKEFGRPVQIGELIPHLEEIGIKVGSNPSSLMTNIMNHDNRIERAMKGYYQVR
jgi:hypothetical protein